MWFFIKDFFLVAWYVILFTFTVGGITYFIYYQFSTTGLSSRSVICMIVTVISCFILSIPFFGAWRVRTHVKELQVKNNELKEIIATTISFTQLDSDQDIGLLIAEKLPIPGRYIPSVTVEQVLQNGIITSFEQATPEQVVSGVSDYFFNEIVNSVNGFILKVFLWLVAFIIIPFIIFYHGVSKENKQALQRRMRMIDYE